jgi:hypothetical protein
LFCRMACKRIGRGTDSALWNAAEASEKRRDARVAREIEVALPHELSAEQRLDLTREFARELADRYGVAVDFAIHSPHGHTDVRNHHAHIMMTTRKVGADGLGREIRRWSLRTRSAVALGLPTSHEQLRDLRISWEERTNAHLARAGLDIRVDHRSHRERGLEIEPTQHMGVHATQMARAGKDRVAGRLDEAAAKRNADLIREKPEQVLTLITGEKSVFDRHDVARVLHRYVDERGGLPGGVCEGHGVAGSGGIAGRRCATSRGGFSSSARYSTREMVSIERDMAVSADRMAGGGGLRCRRPACGCGESRLTQRGGHQLADEQLAAVRHVAGPERIAAVVGLAGCGQEHDAGGGARRRGRRRATASRARRWPARRPRDWKSRPASPSRTLAAGNGAGNAGSTSSGRAMCS